MRCSRPQIILHTLELFPSDLHVAVSFLIESLLFAISGDLPRELAHIPNVSSTRSSPVFFWIKIARSR